MSKIIYQKLQEAMVEWKEACSRVRCKRSQCGRTCRKPDDDLCQFCLMEGYEPYKYSDNYLNRERESETAKKLIEMQLKHIQLLTKQNKKLLRRVLRGKR